MAYGFTYTLPTISGTHSDFAVLLRNADFPTAAIDGGGSSIDNGGGNLRAYTDDTKATQLALDVVVFVAGGTPDISVWVNIDSASTSATIYLEADDVATTQPAVGAAFGRNAVWADENVVLDLTNAVPSAVVDRTGNNATVNDFGGMATGDGEGLTFDGTNDCLEIPDDASLDLVTAYSGRAICKLDQSGSFEAIFNKPAQSTVAFPFGMWNLYKTDGNKVDVRISEDLVTTASVTSTSNAAESTPEEKQCGGVYDKTDIVSFVNGVEEGSTSFTPDIGASNFSFWVGAFNQFNEFLSGKIRFIAIREAVLSANWMKTEYENQLSSGAWGTVGTWEDDSGITGTIAITLDDDTSASTADLIISGSSSITLDDDASTASASLAISATSSVTLDDDTSTSSASISVTGSSNVTLDDDTSASSANLALTAFSNVTLNDDTSAGAAELSITGASAITLDDDTSSSSAALTISASSSITLDDDIMAGSATLGDVISGSMSITLDDDVSSSSANLSLSGSSSVTLDDDVSIANAEITITGSSSVTLDDDTIGAAASIVISGSSSIALDDDAMAGSATISSANITGAINVTLDDDAMAGSATIGSGTHQRNINLQVALGNGNINKSVTLGNGNINNEIQL